MQKRGGAMTRGSNKTKALHTLLFLTSRMRQQIELLWGLKQTLNLHLRHGRLEVLLEDIQLAQPGLMPCARH